MARVTPEQGAILWRDRLSAATDRITMGVNRVTTAPGVLAARNADLWLQRVTAAKDKWARRVSAVSLADWQNAMNNVGVQRVATGAAAHVGKMQSFLTEFLPYVDRIAAQVHALPKGGIEQSVARAAAQIRGNAAFKRGTSGS